MWTRQTAGGSRYIGTTDTRHCLESNVSKLGAGYSWLLWLAATGCAVMSQVESNCGFMGHLDTATRWSGVVTSGNTHSISCSCCCSCCCCCCSCLGPMILAPGVDWWPAAGATLVHFPRNSKIVRYLDIAIKHYPKWNDIVWQILIVFYM